jgi:hypothetical protein
MSVLVLLRHGESAWNAANVFTGWIDVGLCEHGEKQAQRAGGLLQVDLTASHDQLREEPREEAGHYPLHGKYLIHHGAAQLPRGRNLRLAPGIPTSRPDYNEAPRMRLSGEAARPGRERHDRTAGTLVLSRDEFGLCRPFADPARMGS